MGDVTVSVVDSAVAVSVSGTAVTIAETVETVTVTAGVTGPQGASGTGVAFEYTQSTPLATWTITVPVGFARRPNVQVFVSGEAVLADITASSSTVTITFASPQTGTAVLT